MTGLGLGEDTSGKKWAKKGRTRCDGHLRDGGVDGPRPMTPRESRNSSGGDGVVENRKERRLGE